MSHKKLRIALFSTPWEAVPPIKYGGTELVVANLAQGLTARGHAVTVFATGDSRPAGKLAYAHQRAGYRDGVAWGNEAFSLVHTAETFDAIHRSNFDIVHNHYDIWGATFANLLGLPVVTTYHRDLTDLQQQSDYRFFMRIMKRTPMVAISNSQKIHSPEKFNWVGRVYNGINIQDFAFQPTPKDYFLWVGRFTKHKGPHEAIAAAKKAGVNLILAGKVDQYKPQDVRYFEQEIKPHLSNRIRFIGEVGGIKKVRLYQGARGLLMPIHWNEPFGLVMTEALSAGTPVIANNAGSVPEIIKHGKNGFVTKTVGDMVQAIKRIDTIDRAVCRTSVEKQFSLEAMAAGYEAIYTKLIARHKK